MRIQKMLSIMVLGFALCAPSLVPTLHAQDKTPAINEREHNQKERIKEGVESGELNRREARRLHREQGKIHAEERAAKADGQVTAGERAKIEHDQNKASRHIAKQKHDRQAR